MDKTDDFDKIATAIRELFKQLNTTAANACHLQFINPDRGKISPRIMNLLEQEEQLILWQIETPNAETGLNLNQDEKRQLVIQGARLRKLKELLIKIHKAEESPAKQPSFLDALGLKRGSKAR